MSRRWLLSLLCLVVLFLSLVQFTFAGGELRVDETGSTILLDKNPAEVLLAVENPSATELNANVQLELLDPQNKTIIKTNLVQSIARGNQKLKLPLPFAFSTSNEKERNKILWYRLHYRLSPQESPAQTLADGIVSLSEMTSDLFELRVSAPQLVQEGSRYSVRVEAAHPATHRPAQNVRVDAQVTLDADNNNSVKLSGSKLTDDKGRAFIDLEIPRRFPKFPHRTRHAGGELQVTGVKGGMVVQAKGDFLVNQYARALITTDKPLYQPGQVMHVRALLFTPSMTALANHEVYFKICDPEGAALYRTVATTSRFGITSADWTIPENTKLGDYRIWVGIEGGDDQEGHQVRISRYELPNFRVNVEQDRKFYLPGQNATVTVSAEYLFGQPVQRGNVRVVRESRRSWNYSEQKWELDEEAEQKGETNADGSFVAKLDLSSLHEDLKEYDYERFKDITFAAYFTDPTTNRTEQRRFDVRVTIHPIHVYVLEDFDSRYNRNLPLAFYVSTFYADGSPARCKVDVKFSDDGEDSDSIQRVATVTTSRYGLARVNARLPKDLEDITSLDVVVSAFDSRGQKGSNTEGFRVNDEPSVHVETAKAVYMPGESVTAVITSSGLDETVIVDLAGEAGLIRSQRVRLRDGRASVFFPFRPEFKGRLSIVAYSDSGESARTVGVRSVLYPHNSELNVDVRSSRDTLRPGEEAKLNVSVRSAEGRSIDSALGVAVLDQAVMERFRTDQEFGNSGSGFDNIQRFLGFEDQVAGVSLRDLRRIDTSQPLSPDLDLVAAMLLKNTTNHYPSFYSSDEFDEADAVELFAKSIKDQLTPLKKALYDNYNRTMDYPSNGEELRSSLSQSKIDFNAVRDPWGLPYRAAFAVNQQDDTLTLLSNGPDKRSGTEDDFVVEKMSWPYFRSVGETVDRAIIRYHQRTGKFIRDAVTLRDEVASDGVNLYGLRDRWGEPYRLDFEIKETDFILKIRSSGLDKRFSKNPRYPWDDFTIWESKIDYFAEQRAQINAALTENLDRTKTFPQSRKELGQAVRSLGDAFASLRDPWGHPYYATFGTEFVYTGRVNVENRSNFGDTASRTVITPVDQTVAFVGLRSIGPDAKALTDDDFSVATFKGVISEQLRGATTPVVFTSGVVLSTSSGAVVGVVTDPMGAAVSGTRVTATRSPGAEIYETTTNDYGRFSFANLPPGLYEFTFDATGFSRNVITSVLVRAHNIVEVNASLRVGHIAESVQITAEASVVNTAASTAVTSRKRTGTDRIPIVSKSGSQEMSTPRLREYFPETLFWQPSIETGRDGHAQINFKLADNITTWKMLVIGSTEDGRIGTSEKEIKAFQPFFVEHEPPRVLTEGDEISLPVVVRNYLPRPQKVDLEIKPESWFSLLGPAEKQASVIAGDAIRETFDFRVIASVKDGKQRITARGSNENDAIEKPVSVHPDGQELSVTAGDFLDDETSLEFEIAPNMVSNSSRGELKIYPNLIAHVVEGVEKIMKRPYGCGEQTISSTYPSLLLLRYYKKSGEGFPLSGQARRYLSDGYSRLLNYRAESGGFTYWGNGEPDLALTAYALQFLVDAGDLMSVDENVVRSAREWLVKQQQSDGSWRAAGWQDNETHAPTIELTAYVARILARTDAEPSEPLKRALSFLERESQRIDEPYYLASYALAATDAKAGAQVKPILEKLRTRAHEEGNTTYWTLNSNTPFNGWGHAGVVETTALVVQAIAKQCNSQTAACEAERKLINRGLLFLLKEKDHYGVWYSTQTTISVLDAMLLLSSTSGPQNATTQQAVEIVVNGNRLQSPQISDRFNNPVPVDISRFLNTGKNRIEIKRPQGLRLATVQAVANYYVPWTEAKDSSKPDLRLQVKFDKTEAKVNDEITCSVKAERVGGRGNGMMLAEIGIPPGAEVDRSTLQDAARDWNISQYDVLPDRVVIYLWPRANGVSFNFKFRPRFGLKAKNAPSILYDYYNPDSVVVIPPSLFTVRG